MKIGYVIDFFIGIVLVMALFHLQWGIVAALVVGYVIQTGLAMVVDFSVANSIDRNRLDLLPEKQKLQEAYRENMTVIFIAAGMKTVLVIVAIVSLVKMCG